MLLLGFAGFYWVLLGITRFYWVLLGFTGIFLDGCFVSNYLRLVGIRFRVALVQWLFPSVGIDCFLFKMKKTKENRLYWC